MARSRSLVLLFVTALVLAPAWLAPAAAQTCSPVVSETTRVDVEAVENRLVTLPADATWVVRAYDSVPSGDLSAALVAEVEDCYLDANGVRLDDLVMIGVSIDDRESFVLYGDSTEDEIAPQIDSILAAMADDFQQGDFSQGLIDGLESAAEPFAIVEDADTSDGATEDSPVAGSPTEDSPDSSGDFDGRLLLGGAAGLLVGAGGVSEIVRRRRLNERRNQLESRVAGPRAEVGVGRERSARLTHQAELWERTVTGRALSAVQEARLQVRTSMGSVEKSVSLFDQATPSGIGSASNRQLDEGEHRLRELDESIRRLDDSIERLTVLGETFDRLRITLPRKHQILTSEIIDGVALADERAGADFLVDNERVKLRTIDGRLQAIELGPTVPTLLPLDLLTVSDTLESLEAELFAVHHDLQSLPDRLPALQAWAGRLDESTRHEADRVARAREEFQAVSAVHADASWAWAEDHPASAAAWIERSDKLRERALTELASQQRWDDAGRTLEEAGLNLLKADEILDDVDTLMVNLATARAQAPGILVRAAQELEDLKKFVARYDKHLDERFDVEPVGVASALASLENELQQRKPNHLLVAQTANRLTHQIDGLLYDANETNEKIKALKREAQREIERADRAIDRAERSLGWEIFPSRDGKAVDRLKSGLRSVPRGVDPSGEYREHLLEERIGAASRLASEATDLRAQIIARRRRNSSWVVIGGMGGGGRGGGGSSSSGGGGGFGGFSGGGGGFGGFSGGGGGFGGGGGGGGGSW